MIRCKHRAIKPTGGIKSTKGYGFGTFKGVFTPSILTILGVVMYLRFGWVVGNVGTFWTIVIVTVATAVTFFTTLSLSALATNMKVGGGGAYYIISRSLGLETGAAIGLPLFFAQALGISFYIYGFAESLVSSLSPEWLNYIEITLGDPATVIGVTSLVILAVLAYISADFALRTQFIILALIIASLLAFFTGSGESIKEAVELAEKAPVKELNSGFPLNFWTVFAVFFPAVTGIEAGLSMSGDLKDPAKSLPRGTLAAIGVSYVIYLAIPLYLGYIIPHTTELGRELLSDSLIMCKITRWGKIVLLAIWGASISSAMGALLGAPRTLQALAKDAIIPRFIGRGFGKGNDPRIATVITFGIALAGIVLGDLNLIAPILAMFFLTSYCLLNISAGVEGLIGNPSWRPTFRTHWSLSLIGALLCLGIMIQINFPATILAAIIISAVYYFVKRRQLRAHWGDTRYGILMLAARNAVYSMANRSVDEKNWLPNILLLSGAPTSRWCLVELANAIAGKRGLLTVAAIVKENQTSTDRIESIEDTMTSYLNKRDINALVKVTRNKSPLDGAMELVRTYGFGPLVPNTILLGVTEDKDKYYKFIELIKLIRQSQKNLIIVREPENLEIDKINDLDTNIRSINQKQILLRDTSTEKLNPLVGLKEGRIDIWWGGKTNNGALMIALAYMLRQNPDWVKTKGVIKTIIFEESERKSAKSKLDYFIKKSRLGIVGEVILCKNNNIFDTIRGSSKDASMVFLGIRPPGIDEKIEDYIKYYEELLENTKDLPLLVKTLASEDIEFQRIFKC